MFIKALPNIPLADADFHIKSNIDLLIGSDLAPSIMVTGVRHNICGSFLGQETVFGWNLDFYSTSMTMQNDETLAKQISRFCEVEEHTKKFSR